MRPYGKIEVGDVHFSNLSQGLTFTVSCDENTVSIMKDILYNEEATPQEIVKGIRQILEAAIMLNYNRGGMRRKF